jgi:hypothetical protein
MAIATDAQVQRFVDERFRPRAESVRLLLNQFLDDLANIGDVFNAVTQPTPTWTDQRKDGPPHLLVPTDVVAYNTFATDISNAIKNHAQYPIMQKACVRSVQ